MEIWMIWMILGAALGAVIGMFIYAEGILLENERLRGILRVEVAAREVLEAWMDAAYRRRATKFMVKRNREQEVAEYQAQFEDKDGKGRLKTEGNKDE